MYSAHYAIIVKSTKFSLFKLEPNDIKCSKSNGFSATITDERSQRTLIFGSRSRYCFLDECSTSTNASLFACKLYVLPKCAQKGQNKIYYRNPHCILCNNIPFLDNFACGDAWNIGYQDIWKFRSGPAGIPSLPLTPCLPDEARDPFTNLCRKISCKPGFSTLSDKCIVNNDTNLHITRNWQCVKQNSILIFQSSTGLRDTTDCLTEILDINKWFKNGADLIYNSLLLENSIKWTVLEFTNPVGFELLHQIRYIIDAAHAKEIFCDILEIQAFISCDSTDEIFACKQNWYSGTTSDFLRVKTTQHKKFFFNVVKDVYINSQYMIYHEHYVMQARSTIRNEVVFVCGIEVIVSSLDCAFITLNATEYTLNINETILIYAEQHFKKGDFLLMSDGGAQVCYDFISVENGVSKQSIITQILSSRLEVVSFTTTCFSLCGLFGTVTTYAKFKQLRNIYGQGVMSLCVALFWAQLFQMLSKLIPLSDIPCVLFAAMTHFYWLAVSSWWLAVSSWSTVLALILLYQFALRQTKQMSSSIKTTLWLQLVGWGLPLLVVGITLTLHFCNGFQLNVTSIYDISTCWIHAGNAILVAFGTPIAASIIVNTILVVTTLVMLRKGRQRSNVLQNKSMNAGRSKEILLFAKVRAFKFKSILIPHLS